MSAPDCPFCDSAAAERVGQWGGQIITAQWRCTACNSYFEALREEVDDLAESASDSAVARPCPATPPSTESSAPVR